jgi:hypothetical protein
MQAGYELVATSAPRPGRVEASAGRFGRAISYANHLIRRPVGRVEHFFATDQRAHVIPIVHLVFAETPGVGTLGDTSTTTHRGAGPSWRNTISSRRA